MRNILLNQQVAGKAILKMCTMLVRYVIGTYSKLATYFLLVPSLLTRNTLKQYETTEEET